MKFKNESELYRLSSKVENIENARQNFSDGKSVLYFNGVWESDALSDSELAGQFRYANYPTAQGESLSYISPSSGYVLKKQEDKQKEEACIRFLKYMLSENVQAPCCWQDAVRAAEMMRRVRTARRQVRIVEQMKNCRQLHLHMAITMTNLSGRQRLK